MHLKLFVAGLWAMALCMSVWSVKSQPLSKNFEVRYFSTDSKANGETDFKGETAVFSTDDRINFLSYFAQQASAYHNDKDLNTQVAPHNEVKALMASIKQQPLPQVRKRIKLDQWKWLSYRPGQHEESLWEQEKFKGAKNLFLKEGKLVFRNKAAWHWNFAAQTWRCALSWKVRFTEADTKASFFLKDNATGNAFSKIEINKGSLSYFTEGQNAHKLELKPNKWHLIKVEANLDKLNDKQHYNLYVNNKLVADYVVANQEVTQINGFEVQSSAGIAFDELYGVGYHQTNNVKQPYYPHTFIDEHFSIKPSTTGWATAYYNDTKWETATLPLGQGSERHKGEDLYFRKKIQIEDYKRAYLNLEVLDPGGEIWVNGKMVALVNDRYPIRVDITDFLTPNATNLIALKVNHFYLNQARGVLSPHSPLDNNATWFAGRAWIDLTEETFINDVFLYTQSIGDNKADVKTELTIEHTGTLGFKGKATIKMGLWKNNINSLVQVAEKPILVGPEKQKIAIDFSINEPKLWEPKSPELYKVVVELQNNEGKIIDDYVFTTGIRTLSQENGTFHLNNKPAMLNGTQIMGFRAPMEKMMASFRCAPEEWVAKELLMTQKMNCNMLRIHVHGWKEKAIGINDPRYAEYADQMGIMLISAPPAWIREGDWGQVDFEGYHKYMKQTRNHPSIVMWEVSNHPNTFRRNADYESDLFCEKAYNATYPHDPSRLITITSHIAHLKYGNDEGTIDKGGRDLSKAIKEVKLADPGNQMGLNAELSEDLKDTATIEANRAWTAPMVTRGNQDATTGYGAQWSVLRKWPRPYYQELLDSKARAYFNFEHQESIGQPNWNMCKGKPWYLLQSYEWKYDVGSIGRKLSTEEWRESQAWQAFSAYEATKKMRKLDYDGFSWCTLHGGANAATYKKPAIDFLGHGKLVYHIHKNMFQETLAGSNNVDVVYGPDDSIIPMILNLGEEKKVSLTVYIKTGFEGTVIDKKTYKNILLKPGRTVNELEAFSPKVENNGLYFIEYIVEEK